MALPDRLGLVVDRGEPRIVSTTHPGFVTEVRRRRGRSARPRGRPCMLREVSVDIDDQVDGARVVEHGNLSERTDSQDRKVGSNVTGRQVQV